jgi:hypothetical protein
MAVDLYISLAHNLAIIEFSGFVDESDYAEALELYATHQDARHGQDILCDMRSVTGGNIDMVKRIALQVSLDKALNIKGIQRKIIYLTPTADIADLVKPCAALWQASPGVTAYLENSEKGALQLLNIQGSSLDDMCVVKQD